MDEETGARFHPSDMASGRASGKLRWRAPVPLLDRSERSRRL